MDIVFFCHCTFYCFILNSETDVLAFKKKLTCRMYYNLAIWQSIRISLPMSVGDLVTLDIQIVLNFAYFLNVYFIFIDWASLFFFLK